MVLDRFSGGNPTEWILRAEQYFTYLGFSENDWLSLASFYLEGAAFDWFQWLHRNKQFFDWKHFTEKLIVHFQNEHKHINITIDLLQKLDEKLGNIQRALRVCSSSIVENLVLPDVDDKRDSDLPCDESAFIIENPTELDSDAVDECVQSICDDQTHLQVSLTSDLNGGNSKPDVLDAPIGNFSHPTNFTSSMVLMGSDCVRYTPVEIKIAEKKCSRNFAHKMFVEIPNREIETDFEHSIQTTTQVFEEMSHNCCSKVLTNDFDLDNDISENDKVLAKNSQHDMYNFPSQDIKVLSYPISLDASKNMDVNRIPLITDINCPLVNTLRCSSHDLSRVQHAYSRNIGLQNCGYMDKWFDTGQVFVIALEKGVYFDDGKVKIFEFIVKPNFVCEFLEQEVGNHVTDVRSKHKWTTLSSPTYFGDFVIVFLLVLPDASVAKLRSQTVQIICGNQLADNTTTFIPDFVAVMESIIQQMRTRGYEVAVAGTGPDNKHGLIQCYGDLSLLDCVSCYAEAQTILPLCFPFNGGRVYLDGCVMRAENFTFYDQYLGPEDKHVCGNKTTKGTFSQQNAKRAVQQTVANAASNNGYARAQVSLHRPSKKIAYIIADCWKTLSASYCAVCLRDVSAPMLGCSRWSEGRALYIGCFMRYFDTNFLHAISTSGGSSSRAKVIVMATVVVSSVVVSANRLPPTVYSSWRVNLQAYSYFSTGYTLYYTFLNLPFDPAILAIPVTTSSIFVWNPGRSFEAETLLVYPMNPEVLQFLDCSGKFFLLACSNSMYRVWDPGQSWCVCSSILQSESTLRVAFSPSFTHFDIVARGLSFYMTTLALKVTVLTWRSTILVFFLLARHAENKARYVDRHTLETHLFKITAFTSLGMLILWKVDSNLAPHAKDLYRFWLASTWLIVAYFLHGCKLEGLDSSLLGEFWRGICYMVLLHNKFVGLHSLRSGIKQRAVIFNQCCGLENKMEHRWLHISCGTEMKYVSLGKGDTLLLLSWLYLNLEDKVLIEGGVLL